MLLNCLSTFFHVPLFIDPLDCGGVAPCEDDDAASARADPNAGSSEATPAKRKRRSSAEVAHEKAAKSAAKARREEEKRRGVNKFGTALATNALLSMTGADKVMGLLPMRQPRGAPKKFSLLG